LTIGLGAAVAEIIYALSSIHLGLRGTSFNRDLDNQDCAALRKDFGCKMVEVSDSVRNEVWEVVMGSSCSLAGETRNTCRILEGLHRESGCLRLFSVS
jgi:hypothetical protein